jgi:hypothetical protein
MPIPIFRPNETLEDCSATAPGGFICLPRRGIVPQWYDAGCRGREADRIPAGGAVAFLETDPDADRKQRMLRVLSADPDMLALYRNLLICHEIAHVGEWYALTRRGEVVHDTGHGIRDRAEMRILTRLLHAGKVRPAAYAKLFLFYATFMNQDAEPEDDIARYYRQALSPYGALSSADPMADRMPLLAPHPGHPH